MSDQGAGSNLPTPGAARGPGGAARRASVTLSPQRADGDSPALMDPANQSLADALRITYRLVQLAMVVLVVLYLLSGFQSVKENEQGIRLLFGKKEAERIDPGFRFSYPAPIGEMVKVDTGAVKLDVKRRSGKDVNAADADSTDFWVNNPEDQAIEKVNAPASLAPDREGSVLTGDGNIAHTHWKVEYTRDPAQVSRYAENVLPEAETNIVLSAVKRAVVYATAQVTVDDLLKQSTGEGTVAGVAKEYAQGLLDRLGTGVRIDKMILEEKVPPLHLRENFAKVQSAESKASTERERARSEGAQTLSAVAGGAAQALIDLIGKYETAIEKKDPAGQTKYLKAIDAVLDGQAAEADGVKFAEGTVSGEVTAMLSDARQYRSSVVNQRRSDLGIFQAKLGQFNTNPLVMVHSEWVNSLRKFLDRENVEQLYMPADLHTLEIGLNADPDILKRIEKAIKQAEGEKAMADRAAKQQREKFKVDTGLKATPE